MASPAPSDSSSAPAKAQEQITFRFCRECSNLLYPKEDRMTSKLMFACRTCQFSEEAPSSCVFRNNMYNTVGETAGVTQDVGSDPTVGDHFLDLGDGESLFESESLCCTMCGEKVGEDFVELSVGEGKELELRGKQKEVRLGVLDLAEMSRMEDEDEDEEMGGEPDTSPTNLLEIEEELSSGGEPSSLSPSDRVSSKQGSLL